MTTDYDDEAVLAGYEREELVYAHAFGSLAATIGDLDPDDPAVARAQACVAAVERRLDEIAAERRGPQR